MNTLTRDELIGRINLLNSRIGCLRGALLACVDEIEYFKDVSGASNGTETLLKEVGIIIDILKEEY